GLCGSQRERQAARPSRGSYPELKTSHRTLNRCHATQSIYEEGRPCWNHSALRGSSLCSGACRALERATTAGVGLSDGAGIGIFLFVQVRQLLQRCTCSYWARQSGERNTESRHPLVLPRLNVLVHHPMRDAQESPDNATKSKIAT